jgi:hypothetical protein
LYIVNLLIVFVMNGLARAPEQTVLLHWIAESVDTVSCLCFAMAAWIMYQHAPRSVGGDPVVGAEISVVAK